MGACKTASFFSILDRGYHAVTQLLCLLRNLYKNRNSYCPLRRSRGTSPIGEARAVTNLNRFDKRKLTVGLRYEAYG